MPHARPLSPHITLYRWYLSMAVSIGHRVTGGALATFLLFLTAWLVALATGDGAFGAVHGLAGSAVGRLALFVWTVAVFYHMANGVRHLVWDAGYGFEPATARKSGQAVIGFAAGAALLLWLGVAVLG